MTHETDPRRRFSNRVSDYVRYRPGYPPDLLDCVRDVTGLASDWRIADVGSGTGKLTEVFLDNGNPVLAIEPNDAMREAAENLLGEREGFTSVVGSAERTTLADRSVRMVTAAQAFHWFDPDATRREFQRILEPGGWILLVWNTRRVDANPFMRAYEELLHDCAVDYRLVDHRRVDRAALESFMGPYVERRIPFTEWLNLEAVAGRMQSASYVPAPDHPGHPAIVERLRERFDALQEEGRVPFAYETEAYFFGPLATP